MTARSHALQGAIGRSDRMCLHQSTWHFHLGFTIRYNSTWPDSHFHFCFFFYFPCSKIPKQDWKTGAITLLTFSCWPCLNSSIFRGLLHRAALSGLALPQILPLQIVNFPMISIDLKLFGTCGTCGTGKWYPRCGPVRLAPDPDAERAALLAAVQDYFHFHAIFVCKSQTSKNLPGTTPTKSRPSIIILKNQI